MPYIPKKSVIFFILIIFAFAMNAEKKSSSLFYQGEEKTSKRVGSLIKVRPEYEERYIILHRHTFPGVLDRIRKSNIRNYSIFLLNGILFSYYEYIGNDYEADIKAIADSVTRDWWKLTDPMQEPLPTRKEGEWWAEMQQLICLDKKIGPSPKARRIGITAEVIPGKEEELKELCENFPPDLEAETNKKNFQNANMFFNDGRVYYYYEYTGDDIRKSLSEIGQNKIFKDFQDEMNKLLVPKQNGYWEIMQEVFHTD
ncbi:MAG TPA: L-rhamnose mutarotase [Ignavibacteriaceae bacterium]|nr:L-rhamnose mutarotase [Ignavibacteriaceae bacterium]